MGHGIHDNEFEGQFCQGVSRDLLDLACFHTLSWNDKQSALQTCMRGKNYEVKDLTNCQTWILQQCEEAICGLQKRQSALTRISTADELSAHRVFLASVVVESHLACLTQLQRTIDNQDILQS